MSATPLAATVQYNDPALATDVLAGTYTTAGVTPAAADTESGNSFVNDPADVVLVAENTSGDDQTIAFTTQAPDRQGTLINPQTGTLTFTLPAGTTSVIGPFDPKVFGAPTSPDGVVDTQGGADSKIVSQVEFLASSAEVLVYTLSLKAALQTLIVTTDV